MSTVLFIGGASDGVFRQIDSLANEIRIPVLFDKRVQDQPQYPLHRKFTEADLAPTEHVYHLEALKGQNETFYFYRWEKLTIDEAIMRLLSGYQSMNTLHKRR